MKKKIDAIAMKRKAQEKIYEEIKDLSTEEQIEYFNKAGEKFWAEIGKMRAEASSKQKRSGEPRKKQKAASKKG